VESGAFSSTAASSRLFLSVCFCKSSTFDTSEFQFGIQAFSTNNFDLGHYHHFLYLNIAADNCLKTQKIVLIFIY